MSGPATENEDSSLFPAAEEWERLRTLVAAVDAGERPEVTGELREYVARVARQTGVDSSVITAVASDPERVLHVAREARRRIRSGSQRLMIALNTAFDAAEGGDHAGARKILQELVESEVVPFYREQARIHLDQLGLARER